MPEAIDFERCPNTRGLVPFRNRTIAGVAAVAVAELAG